MTENSEKTDICRLYMEELAGSLKELGEPAYRASQVFKWLHQKKAESFSEMTDLSKALREKLEAGFAITVMHPEKVLVSGIDGTRKYVFSLKDGNVIESVFMRYHHGNSVCISSQVGCRMGCRFCASTIGGCVRSLTASEMLWEVYRIEKDTGEHVSNVVIMGSGEPLDNYEEVVRFLRLITDKNGQDMSSRNITVSTCGLTPGIRKLAEEGIPVTLALSLHAPTQELREQIMPIAKAYPLREVLDACKVYWQKTGRRLSFEYSVGKGVNDSMENADRLAKLLSGMHGHVNLIPINPVKETGYRQPGREAVEAFRDRLLSHGINVTIRREMGRDISSACGQLRRSHLNDHASGTD